MIEHSYPRRFVIVVDIDVAVLCLCLEESICRFGSCCDLHQNRFLGRNLYDNYDIASVSAAVAVAVIVVVSVVAANYSPSRQHNHVVMPCLCLAGIFLHVLSLIRSS
jgi:hypothetical protein